MKRNVQCILWIRRALFTISLIGLFVSSYLFITYTYGAAIACGGSQGCDMVRASRWASMYGVSTPLLGIVFYTAVAGLCIVRTAMPSYQPKRMRWILMAVVTAGFIESAFLTFVQYAEIRAYCTWCLASAVTATLLFITAWWDRALTFELPVMLRELKLQFYLLMAAAVMGVVAMVLLVMPESDGELPMIKPYEVSEEERKAARAFLYREGLAYEGPEQAEVTIIEFMDFQCASCRAASREVREVREEMAGDVRFAYRHFPLPQHEYAKDVAHAVVCAEAQGSGFPYVEVLLEEQGITRSDLVRYAAELRMDLDAFVPCLDSQQAEKRVLQDLRDGSALGVTSSPTVFVNTTMIRGAPSSDQLKQVIERELTR